ncbi:XRE family transcriptional regulator [Zhongshania sp.]|uniref:XRE family transcriptional regulator n=1 Tax=Zhongshania sp. TaxID=1971902 RepID=UPI003569112E
MAHKEETGATQESFAAQLGVTQGTLQQIFRGDIAAPFEILLDLALSLDFDPREVRPSVSRIQSKLNRAIAGKDAENLETRLKELPDDLQAAALEYLNFLASKRQLDSGE